MSLFDTCCFTGHPPFFLPSLFSALLFSWFFLLLLFSFFLPNFLFSLPLLFPDPSPHHNIHKTCSYALELFYASVWKLMVWQVGAARLDLFHIYWVGIQTRWWGWRGCTGGLTSGRPCCRGSHSFLALHEAKRMWEWPSSVQGSVSSGS